MTVIKVTKNRKALLVIDDDGRTYSTSVNFLMGLINGKSKHDFVLMTRLPQNNTDTRFKKSPLYDPEGKYNPKTFDNLGTHNDGLSAKSIESNKKKKEFSDKKVW